MSLEPPAESKPASPSTQLASDRAHQIIIGRSKENRPICCVWRGRAGATLKVLILAGQHGDERSARRTLQSLLVLPAEEVPTRLPAVQLDAIQPLASLPGGAMRARHTECP